MSLIRPDFKQQGHAVCTTWIAIVTGKTTYYQCTGWSGWVSVNELILVQHVRPKFSIFDKHDIVSY